MFIVSIQKEESISIRWVKHINVHVQYEYTASFRTATIFMKVITKLEVFFSSDYLYLVYHS